MSSWLYPQQIMEQEAADRQAKMRRDLRRGVNFDCGLRPHPLDEIGRRTGDLLTRCLELRPLVSRAGRDDFMAAVRHAKLAREHAFRAVHLTEQQEEQERQKNTSQEKTR